jgi:hypothetical protein
VFAMLLVACSAPAPKPVACPAMQHEPASRRRQLDDPSATAIEGLIADDKACAPLANATIVVTDGRYLVTGLLPGTYKMTIYFCDGWTERDVAVVWMS